MKTEGVKNSIQILSERYKIGCSTIRDWATYGVYKLDHVKKFDRSFAAFIRDNKIRMHLKTLRQKFIEWQGEGDEVIFNPTNFWVANFVKRHELQDYLIFDDDEKLNLEIKIPSK